MNRRILAQGALSLALLGILAAPPAFATTWIVDKQNPACSDAGPGTPAAPFCTIGKGASVALAGDTVQIKKGVYREQINPAASGAPGMPITYRGTWPLTLILGTNALSGSASWSPAGPTSWSIPYDPPSNPTQVFVDGMRLAVAGSAATLTPNSFFFDAVANVLYVDIGGSNPGVGHIVEAGARDYGFQLASGRSNIVIRDVAIWGTNRTGIRAFNTTNFAVLQNRISFAAEYGVSLEGGTGATLRGNLSQHNGDSGFRVVDATAFTVEENTSKSNGLFGIEVVRGSGHTIKGNKILQNARQGINIENSAGNQVIANTTSNNRDSGLVVRLGSANNLVARNVAYGNTDNGLEVFAATGTRLISNTVYGNVQEGIEMDSNSTGTTLANNISVDNGVSVGQPEISVDPTSVAGFTADYDLLWKSGGGSLARIGATTYSTMAALMGAGYEADGLSANPNFVSAMGGDFHIRFGPAIDSADAGVAGFVQPDRDGTLPYDIPGVVDTGAGVPTFADRGAFEYVDRPPKVALIVLPFIGRAPHKVLAVGLAIDDVGVTSFTFDFGDGTVVGPQTSFWTTHTYMNPGVYTVKVTAADVAGNQSMSSRQVLVLRPGGWHW